MYCHIICLGDKPWDILEDEINFVVDGIRMVAGRKSLTHAKKRLTIRIRVKGVLVDAPPHLEYLKIINKW